MLPDLKIEITIIIFIIWNIIVFAMYGIDKNKSQKRKRRISEKTLILSAFFMGGTGALLGMHVFRHKTKHWEFKIGIPLLLLLNIIIIVIFIIVFLYE